MSIKINFYSLFRINLSSAGEEYNIKNHINVEELITKLDEDYNNYFSNKMIENNKIKKGSIILINGKNILHLDGLQTTITDGDKIDLFPPSAGG